MLFIIKEACTLHRWVPFVYTASCYLNTFPTESLLLIIIQGLKLPNEPRILHEIYCHRCLTWVVQHLFVCYDSAGYLLPFLCPIFPSFFVEQPAFMVRHPALANLCIDIWYPSAVEEGLEIDVFSSHVRDEGGLGPLNPLMYILNSI